MPSTELMRKLKETSFIPKKERAGVIYSMAVAEGYSPQEARQLVMDHLHVSKSNISRYLPFKARRPYNQSSQEGMPPHLKNIRMPKRLLKDMGLLLRMEEDIEMTLDIRTGQITHVLPRDITKHYFIKRPEIAYTEDVSIPTSEVVPRLEAILLSGRRNERRQDLDNLLNRLTTEQKSHVGWLCITALKQWRNYVRFKALANYMSAVAT